MIVLLYGLDELAVRRRLQQLRDQADGGTGMLQTNIIALDGRDAKPADIIAPAMSPPFLSPYRLVLIEAFLNRWEPRIDQYQPRSIAPFEPLFTELERGLPETTMLVFTGVPPDSPQLRDRAFQRNPMIDRLAQISGVQKEEHPEPKPQEMIRFVRDEAAARGIRLRPGPFREELPHDEELRRLSDPAAYLAALLQGDTLGISNELDKLSLYSLGKDVTVDTVHAVCSGAITSNQFAFTDAVLDGDQRTALVTLERLRRDGAADALVLTTLIGAYRTLVSVQDLLEEGKTPEDIGKAIRRPWPKLRDAAIARARRLGRHGVRASFEAIVHAERMHKSGQVDDDLWFELLIARLTALAAPPAPARVR